VKKKRPKILLSTVQLAYHLLLHKL